MSDRPSEHPAGFAAHLLRRTRPALLAGLGALLGAFFLLGRGTIELRSAVAGIGGDPFQTLWRAMALAEAIKGGSLALPGDPIRNLGPLPWLPIHAVIGEPLAYNVVWLLQFPLSVLAVFALGRVLGIAPWPAALAGFLVAFAPTRLAQSLGHFGAMQLFWIPATLAVLLWWLRSPTFPRTLALGIAVVGTAWTEHTLFLTTLIAGAYALVCFSTALRALIRSTGKSGGVPRRSPARLGGMLLVLLLFVGLGAVWPFRREMSAVWAPASPLNPGPEQRLRFTPTVRSLMVPPPFHALALSPHPYGTSTESAADRVHTLGGASVTAAAVAVVVLLRRGERRRAAFLGGLALLGVGLALAPLTSAGSDLFQRAPLFSAIRAVNRFLALPAFALPLLAVTLVPTLGRGQSGATGNRWSTRQRAAAVAILLLGSALFLDILPSAPFPLQQARIPAFYASLKDTPPGAVLEIPAATDYLVASRAVYASALHGREVLGHIAFERADDPREREALLRVPFAGDALLVRPEHLRRPTVFGQDPLLLARASFASEGIAAVVVHTTVEGRPVLGFGVPRPTAAAAEDIAAVRAALQDAGFSENAVDGDTFLYLIPPWPSGQSMAFAVAREGWEQWRRRDRTPYTVVARDARFEVRVVGESARAVAVTFRVARESASRSVRLVGNGGSDLRAPVQPGSSLVLPLGNLPPGRHTYQVSVDAAPLIVENLTLRDSPSDV